jgi:hypothetical protein
MHVEFLENTAMISQPGFFDLQRRYEKLSELGDPLEALSVAVDFEQFRRLLNQSAAGRNTQTIVDNPRYLILREGTVYGMKRDDYHAVPLKLGVKKETAQMFYNAWCKYVGPTELIYTRTEEGRKALLKARMKAFSALFSKQVKREDRWQ